VEKPPEEAINSVKKALYKVFVERGDPETMALDVLLEELVREAGVSEVETLAALAILAVEGTIEFTLRNPTRDGVRLAREAAVALAEAYVSGRGSEREAEAALLLAGVTGDAENIVREALKQALCPKLEKLAKSSSTILRRALEYEVNAATARARRLSPAIADMLEGADLDRIRGVLCSGGGE